MAQDVQRKFLKNTCSDSIAKLLYELNTVELQPEGNKRIRRPGWVGSSPIGEGRGAMKIDAVTRDTGWFDGQNIEDSLLDPGHLIAQG